MAIESGTPERRSRRAILTGALGGVAGLIAGRFGTADTANAASGDPLILGVLTNNSGVTGTKLSTNGTDVGLYVQQNGTGSALRGVANNGIAGFFTSSNGTGISGVTAKDTQFGVYGANDALTFGGGEAIRANGKENHGLVATTARYNAYAVKAISSALNGIAVKGQTTATTASYATAIQGQTDGEYGYGVTGWATSATGTPNGVYGLADAPNGNAVYGQMTSLFFGDGAAVRAEGGQNHGVVAATANASAYAVKATTSAVDGTAIKGEATATTGTSIGVHGESAFVGNGVYGHAGGGAGVHGVVDDAGGYGVLGFATATSGVNYGVFGSTNSPAGYGVLSNGNAYVFGALEVTGAITAGTKDFKIDHPLDPAQKFLSHSCVESDDRRTVYDGEVTLDAKGEATVVLPAWFETLNKSCRYQLTAIGPTDRILYVKSKVKNNAFSIGGGSAGQEVCWQVTGIRQDAYAKAHPLAVEAAKTGTERGRYLHPEVYGKPASKSIGALHAHPVPSTDPSGASVPASGH